MLKKTFILAIFIFIPVYTSAQIVENGLVSYWSFDKAKMQGKTIKDGTGAHDGTIQGNLKQVAGKIGEALEFDGNEANYVEIGNPKGFNFNADFTWAAWIQTDLKTPGTIFAKTGGPGTDDKGPKTWWITDGVQSFDTGWVGNVKDTQPITDNKWHHLAVTVTAKEGAIQYYVDGKVTGKGQMALTQFPEDGFKNFVFIGLDGRADGEFGVFDGIIDEFAVYNRVLTANEVRQNVESKGGLAVESAGKLAVTWGKLKSR